ncbi:MAG: hypothetical protein AB7G28_07895 [Pirellulales bacterium]
MNIISAIKDEMIFATFFTDPKTRQIEFESYKNWFVALRVLYGLPITSARSRKLVRECTGRDPRKLPKKGFQTAIFLCGRRGGKSQASAIIAAYEATLTDAHKRLTPGSVGTVGIVTPSLRQGGTIREYLRKLFATPLLKSSVVSDRQDLFTTNFGVRVEVLPADYKYVRGFTFLSAIVDEAAFIGVEEEGKKRSDTEVIRALEPGLITTGGKLLVLTTPYGKVGWVYENFTKHFGDDQSEVLCWRAPTPVMNPKIDQKWIARKLKEDYVAARSEIFCEWREDVGLLIAREVIEKLVVKGHVEGVPRGQHRYYAFVDVSGGRGDSSALAIAHKDGGRIILDYAKVYPAPHSPQEIIGVMAETLRQFRVSKVTGDAYGAEFCASAFGAHRITLIQSPKNKSALYAELLPILCSGDVELLDNELLVNQLASLERRTRSGGRDVIDHPRGKTDDLANAVAGVIVVASRPTISIGAGGF